MAINTYKLPDDKILLSSEIAHGNKTLEQIIKSLFYSKGDTFEASSVVVGGFLTTGNKDVCFSLVLPKKLDDITSITINSMKATARCNNTYILGNGSAGKDIKTVYVRKVSENQLFFRYSSSTSLGGTNNTAVGLVLDDIKITFN